ncbi:hypothetical protein CR513_37475, partial [Mucuna pruriens]
MLQKFWSKSRFKANLKSDILLNNMSEGFNNVIVIAREKSIMTMLEEIKLVRKWPFEVRHINFLRDKFVFNLKTHECSCKKWMLTSIPCCHVISCMNYMNIEAKDYIPAYFKKET